MRAGAEVRFVYYLALCHILINLNPHHHLPSKLSRITPIFAPMRKHSVSISASTSGTPFSRTRSAIPATALAPTTAGRLPERVVCSLYDTGRIDSPVGVCFVHFSTGEVTLSTIWDSQTHVRTFHKIAVHDPTEVVLAAKESKLHAILKVNVDSDVKIIATGKKWFNADSGLEVLKSSSLQSDTNYLIKELQDQPAALSALAGAFHYITTHSRTTVLYDHWRIKYESLESFVNIDVQTIRSLDILSNALDRNGISVLKFLNSTLTNMGERALKTNLLQPLTDRQSIEERLKSVKELREGFDMLSSLRGELKGLQDLDKLFAVLLLSRDQASVSNSTQKVNDVILVKQAVTAAHNIGLVLQGCTSPLLQQIRDICQHEAISRVRDLIDESINEDCSWEAAALDLKNQQCYAVKAGRNDLLDVSRQVYKAVVDEVLNIINILSEEHHLDLEQSYNNKRGFYVKILDSKNLSLIPNEFINRSEKKKFLECTTLDIMKCNARLDDTINEILTISNEVIESLIQEITEFLPILFMVAEALGTLDLLQSFAFHAAKFNYICPEFSNSITLKASRHPVLETLIPNFIPNDVCCIDDVSRFQVITGTNMSGKSVYLRQVVLLSIMAQMGSFVPAEFASFKVFDCIRARISVDSVSTNVSTFASEMSEMVCILEDINKDSLVIIDELGRGSSINDAFAITLSICEHLVTTGAYVFTATHFHEISSILGTHQGVIENHMKTNMSEEDGMITMNYRLTNGVTEAKRYGVKMARNFFSKEIITRANEISKTLEGSSNEDKVEKERMSKDKRFLNLVAVLQYVSQSADLNASLLRDIQDEFLE